MDVRQVERTLRVTKSWTHFNWAAHQLTHFQGQYCETSGRVSEAKRSNLDSVNHNELVPEEEGLTGSTGGL